MKYPAIRILALIAAGVAGALQLSADTFTLLDGTQIDGEIHRSFGDRITFTADDGSRTTRLISEFDAEGKASIDEWKAAHPEKTDVHTQWDTQPIIVSSQLPRLPEQFLESTFKGYVSIDLILDASGQVLHASVKNATHEALEGPSIEAARNWTFEPAKVDGKPVKSKLRVPFKFSHTPPQRSLIDRLSPQSAFAL